ncbi:MAG: hypothetical protein R3330_15970, partial [Saprospiraceae bacterium]|nr:hypothetical protein [Saprospiraceae bacterium]
MRKPGELILAGLLPVIVLLLFMKFVSLDLSYAAAVGVLCLLLASWWQQRNASNPLVKVLVLAGPLTILFYMLVVRELPGLWIVLPCFGLAALVGAVTDHRQVKLIATAGLLLGVVVLSTRIIPRII